MRKFSSVLTDNPLAEEKASPLKRLVTVAKRFQLPAWFRLPAREPVIRSSSDLLKSPKVQEQLKACRRLYMTNERYGTHPYKKVTR